MKKSLLLAIAALCATMTFAITPEELADSLNVFASQRAYLGKVKVSDMQIDENNITITTCNRLSCVSLTPEEIAGLKESVRQWVGGAPTAQVHILSDGKELDEWVTALYRKRDKKLQYKPASAKYPLVHNASQPYSAKQGLDGKHIALWGSHGIYYVQAYRMWKWQRARLWTTIEDLYTSSYTMPFLVPMLENAGAVVLQPRERDTQLHEVIVDDSQLAMGITPAEGTGWGRPLKPLLEGDNPFAMGGYSTVKSTAQYTPTLPEAGEYAVYVSYKSLPKSNPQAEYTVVHKGISTTYHVNQQMGGGTWIYLGTFDFGTDANSNFVTLTHKGKHITTTDAVKFGGGWGSVARYPHPEIGDDDFYTKKDTHSQEVVTDSTKHIENQAFATTSGYPRYIEGARYWLQYAGIPDSVYNYTGSKNDYTDDFSCRGRWVNYLAGGSTAYPEGPGLNIPVNMSVAFHSDAGCHPTDKLVGTFMFYTIKDDDKETTYPSGGDRICNRDFADFIQTQIVEDIRQTMMPTWQKRHLMHQSMSETRNPKVPSTIIELLSHHNYYDMTFGLDPKFKFIASRAIYKGMLRFIHQTTGTPYVVQPLPVQQMNISYANNDSLHIRWAERVDRLEPTATPTYYIIYTRTSQLRDGQWQTSDWDNGIRVTTPHATLPIQRGVKYDIMVRAGNDGGVSLPSEVLSAYIDAKYDNKLALIINGFHRVDAPEMFGIDSITGGVVPGSYAVSYGKEISFLGEQFDYDRTNMWESDDDCGFGMCHADKQKEVNIGNTFDYPSMHGNTLAQMGISYVSTSINAIESLEPYTLVDIIMGKEKGEKTDTIGCIPMHLRKAIETYTEQGGKILLAGSYIASDMRHTCDTAFTHNVLHYRYKTEKASTCGRINFQYNILPTQQYEYYTTPNPQVIECEWPDGIEPMTGGVRIARYDDTYVNAGVAYQDDKNRMIILPFMLESVKDFHALYSDCINWLLLNP